MTAACSLRRSHLGKVTGSVQTLSKPKDLNFALAQATARGSASPPAMRGPTSVVNDSTTAKPVLSASACSRNCAAVRNALSGMLVGAASAAEVASRAEMATARRRMQDGSNDKGDSELISARSPVCVRKVILVCEVRARMWPLVYGTVGFLSVSFLSESRISRSSSTSSLGPLGASGLRWLRRLISLTTRKIAKAMITNCTTVLMKSP